jgi:uncharacterized protein (TIGR02246 family)
MRNAAAATIAIVLMACAERTEMPAHDPAADKAAVDAVRNREIAALSAGNTDSLLAVYADDIDMMAPGFPASQGLAAVRTMIDGMLKEVTMSGSYMTSNVEIIGDVAIDRYTGSLTLTPKAGGPATIEVIKGLHVLRRQADGSWKIVQDVWNTDAPAVPPPSK